MPAPQCPVPDSWPDDFEARIDAKLDACLGLIHGDPADPTKPGIDGRLRAVERDVAYAKRGALVVLTGGLPMLWDFIKRKVGQ